MRKSYYCKFGTNMPVEELREIFYKYFDMEFELHESSYIGEYYKYSGLYADKLTINPKESAAPDSLDDEAYKIYSCLIFLSNTNGKNADKLAKTKDMKHQIGKIGKIDMLSDEIFEEE